MYFGSSAKCVSANLHRFKATEAPKNGVSDRILWGRMVCSPIKYCGSSYALHSVYILKGAALSTVTQLHGQNSAGQAKGDGVGHHNGPGAQQQTIGQPQRNAGGGQAGGYVADEFARGHAASAGEGAS
jgi:hypothetical protein